jgi:hypothetical protein
LRPQTKRRHHPNRANRNVPQPGAREQSFCCGVRADAFSLASAANQAKSTDAGLSAWRALPRDVRIARRPRQELGILLPSRDIALIETTSTIFFR